MSKITIGEFDLATSVEVVRNEADFYRARMLEDAARIAALDPGRFDMRGIGDRNDSYFRECQAPGCIGAWVRAWHAGPGAVLSITTFGMERWGLTFHQVQQLMIPGTDKAMAHMANGTWAFDATPRQASHALLNLAWTAYPLGGRALDPAGDAGWERVR